LTSWEPASLARKTQLQEDSLL